VTLVNVPDFLYLGVSAPLLEEARRDGSLSGPEGSSLRLFHDEEHASTPDTDQVLVVESGRARNAGVVFEEASEPGVHLAESIPTRYLISLRHGFERQLSAGGVLVRRADGEAQFALIRTLPRAVVNEPPDIEDPRGSDDRRKHDDRRRGEERSAPPDGVERRRSGQRRQRRRRRSGRWGPNGRLELPKGKLEAGETPQQAAVREVREELGLADEAITLHAELSRNNYAFRTPEGKSIFKTVYYYLLECPEDHAPVFHPRREEGIVGVEWWPAKRAIAQVAFRNLRPVLERAWELVRSGAM
jgi:8-oxo-dGTP pyrophosphatase MutT (NUDIX family)